jgi:hypothetical protein
MRSNKPTTTGSDPRPLFVPLLGRLERWREYWLWFIRSKMAERRAHWQEPQLFNAARKRPAWQSSTHGRESAYGAHRGTNGLVGKSGSVFSTMREEHPWWMVDLRADWPIHSIRIHNGRGPTTPAVARLQVSTSSDQQEWDVVHSSDHHFGDAASAGPLIIDLPDTRGGRFVKLELPQGGTLALNQIEVMVASQHKALFRVSRRYGFAFGRMTSLRMPRHVKPFSVRNAPWRFDGRIGAFHINAPQGRFGNNLRQIGTAVCLAQHLGVPRVYLTKLPMLEIDGPIKFRDVTILPESELELDNVEGLLCGTFFYRQPLGKILSDLTYRHIAEAARSVAQPIFYRVQTPPAIVPTEADLAIHIRAGDIFARRIPHRAYTQPPLAYYRLCVEFARAHLGITRVILVYQDEGNPCIGALKSWLDEIGMPYVFQSRSLEEDIAVLLAAPHCVFGRGSFGPAIAILSKHMKTGFFSWLEPSFHVFSHVTGIRLVEIEDSADSYIARGDWRNTPEQKQMMLDYPIENLRLKADWALDQPPARPYSSVNRTMSSSPQ